MSAPNTTLKTWTISGFWLVNVGEDVARRKNTRDHANFEKIDILFEHATEVKRPVKDVSDGRYQITEEAVRRAAVLIAHVERCRERIAKREEAVFKELCAALDDYCVEAIAADDAKLKAEVSR